MGFSLQLCAIKIPQNIEEENSRFNKQFFFSNNYKMLLQQTVDNFDDLKISR